jgi:histidine triad (HIT) family protein
MDNCIFCKIGRGEIPAYKIYEDKDFLGFLDINPHTKGHTLVIPKQHYQWVYDVPDFGKYWETALTVTKTILDKLQPQFISYLTYGLDVPHAHIHIIPRYTGAAEEMLKRLQIGKEEMRSIIQKLS